MSEHYWRDRAEAAEARVTELRELLREVEKRLPTVVVIDDLGYYCLDEAAWNRYEEASNLITAAVTLRSV